VGGHDTLRSEDLVTSHRPGHEPALAANASRQSFGATAMTFSGALVEPGIEVDPEEQ